MDLKGKEDCVKSCERQVFVDLEEKRLCGFG